MKCTAKSELGRMLDATCNNMYADNHRLSNFVEDFKKIHNFWSRFFDQKHSTANWRRNRTFRFQVLLNFLQQYQNSYQKWDFSEWWFRHRWTPHHEMDISFLECTINFVAFVCYSVRIVYTRGVSVRIDESV